MSLFQSRREKALKAKASQLYGTAMAQARQPAFYADLGVEDTPDGRLAMISLHVLLVVDRLTGDAGAGALSNEGREAASTAIHEGSNRDVAPAERLGQHVMEVFVEDLDQAMRELGISDTGVPKRVKRAIGQFYALARAFKAAQGEPEESHVLKDQLAKMCPGLGTSSYPIATLIQYLEASQQHLQHISQNDLEAGRITFPQMDTFLS